ncbi:hypothetical protein D9M68_580900 [compost metagenome]
MLAHQRFALGLQLIDLGAARGNLGVLARAGEERQVEGELHGHHVAELAPPTLVVHLPAPVRLLLRLGLAHPGFGFPRHGPVGRKLRVAMQGMQVAGGLDGPVRKVAGKGEGGVLANPAFERRSRLGHLKRQFVLLLRQLGRFLPGFDRVQGLASPSRQASADSLGQQAVLLEEIVEPGELALPGVGRDPGQGGFPADFYAFCLRLGRRALDRRPGRFDPRTALVAIGHFLHHADHLHGHEVAIQAPAVVALDGYVLQAQGQFRIRQLAGG